MLVPSERNAVNIMYFVCKDETLSVDAAIWKMLGRKVGTLEQVIDGGSGKEVRGRTDCSDGLYFVLCRCLTLFYLLLSSLESGNVCQGSQGNRRER